MAAAVTTEPLPDGGRPPVPLGRRVELPQRGTTFVREVPGPPGAPTLLAPPRLGCERGTELVPGVRAPLRALPAARARPARPRPRRAQLARVPSRRLCRRLRRDAGRHRDDGPGHRGRLLDGRPGRSAALAPPPRPRRRTRPVRDQRGLPPRPRLPARVAGVDARLGRGRPGRGARARPCIGAERRVAPQRVTDVGRGRDAPPRLADDPRGRPLAHDVPRGLDR